MYELFDLVFDAVLMERYQLDVVQILKLFNKRALSLIYIISVVSELCKGITV